MKKLLFIGIPIVVFGALFFSRPQKPMAENMASGAMLISVPDGEDLSLADFLAQKEGKVLVFNFWATWCGPCLEEIPILEEIHEEYAADGVEVIGVSVDEGGFSVVESFLKRRPVDYPIYLADEDVIQTFGGIYGVPTTFIISSDGVVAQRMVGAQRKDTLVEAFQKEL